MAKPINVERKLVSVKEAAIILDISIETCWQWIYEKRFESLKLGRCRKVRIKELERFMDANTIARAK
jgi:excisionase family DNA binding protein